MPDGIWGSMFYRPFCKSTKRTDKIDSNIRQNKNLQTEVIDLDYIFPIGSFRRFAEWSIKHPFLNPFRRCYKRNGKDWYCLGYEVINLHTLDSGINIGVRLLIFGLFSRGYVLIREGNAYLFFKISAIWWYWGCLF